MKRIFLAILLLLPVVVLGYESPGSPTGFVNDYAALLSAEERSLLEEKLSAFQAKTGNEIVVVTVKSLEGDTIENFAEKLFKEWGIGKAKEDNGALLLIAKEDRAMRIEVGYGLEGQLTDILSSRLIREVLTPAFQKEEFFAGISSATDKMMQTLSGEEVSLTDSSNSTTDFSGIGDLLFFGFFIFISFLSSILGRSKSWWAGGVVGLVIAVILGFIFTITFALISAVVLVPLGLLFDYLVSKNYKNSVTDNRRPPWWLGGGGLGGGGRGFGGFGGGLSGGGGASGRW